MNYSKINIIRDALLNVSNSVWHYEAAEQTEKYIVWAEDGEGNSLHAGNQKTEQVIQGTIDYFTKEEGDLTVDKIENALSIDEISFYLNSVQYEDETGFIHYEWIWEVI